MFVKCGLKSVPTVMEWAWEEFVVETGWGGLPSVLRHCSLGGRKGIQHVKKLGVGFVDGDILAGALHVL